MWGQECVEIDIHKTVQHLSSASLTSSRSVCPAMKACRVAASAALRPFSSSSKRRRSVSTLRMSEMPHTILHGLSQTETLYTFFGQARGLLCLLLLLLQLLLSLLFGLGFWGLLWYTRSDLNRETRD